MARGTCHVIYLTNDSAHKCQALQPYDPRVRVLKEDGYDWSGYTKIEQTGLLDDVEVIDWQNGHIFSSYKLAFIINCSEQSIHSWS